MYNEQMKSMLTLERMAFEEIKYSRSVDSAAVSREIEMNFTRQVRESEDHEHFRVSLTANIWAKEDQDIKLEVTLVGFFFCNCENETLKKDLINKNAIAILFPYLRSQISLITTQPDIQPITIQPMNIVAMFDEAES